MASDAITGASIGVPSGPWAEEMLPLRGWGSPQPRHWGDLLTPPPGVPSSGRGGSSPRGGGEGRVARCPRRRRRRRGAGR